METLDIKFRFWDKENKKMWFDGSTAASQLLTESIDGAMLIPRKDVVILQSTGLRDKNSTEIYRGDLLKDKDGLILECDWNKRYAGFFFYGSDKYVYQYESCENLEVIGNVYENPELKVFITTTKTI